MGGLRMRTEGECKAGPSLPQRKICLFISALSHYPYKNGWGRDKGRSPSGPLVQ